MFELSFDSQQSGAIFTPSYNHLGLSDYQDPLYAINPSNSSQLLPDTQLIIDTVIQSIDATKDILTGLSSNSQIDEIMSVAFGQDYQKDLADQLLAHFEQNNFTNAPDIELVSGQIFNGAYGKETNTIYLSQEFVVDNLGNVGAVTGVLLEEYGHYIDGLINVVDAAGDEGYIFSQLVQGNTLDSAELGVLKLEDDHGFLVIDGVSVGIEKSEVAMASLNGRLYQSIRDQDNSILTRSSTDGVNWTAWNNHGGGSTSGGVDLKVFNKKLYQSVRGTDNQIYIRSSSDGSNWTNWQNFGGTTLSGPDLEVFNGRLYQSVRGTDNQIYIRSSSDGNNWTNWRNFGGTTLSGPDLEVFNGRLYQSVRGTDNQIYIRSSGDGVSWTGWNKNGGGTTLSGPDLEVFNGRLYQSVRGTDNQIYIRSSGDGVSWTGWNKNGGGTTLSEPDLEVFNSKLYQSVRGLDNEIYTRSSTDGVNWAGWSKGTIITVPSGLMTTSSNLTQLINGQLNGKYIDVDGYPTSNKYQCYDLVAYSTGINSSSSYWLTSNWKAGENVIANRNIPVGTAIATFKGVNNSYYGHTAIFGGYDTVNGVFGFWAWSQNFPTGSGVKKHFVPTNGSSSKNNNANEYYIVRV